MNLVLTHADLDLPLLVFRHGIPPCRHCRRRCQQSAQTHQARHANLHKLFTYTHVHLLNWFVSRMERIASIGQESRSRKSSVLALTVKSVSHRGADGSVTQKLRFSQRMASRMSCDGDVRPEKTHCWLKGP